MPTSRRRSAFQGLLSESDRAILSHLEDFGKEERITDAADYILAQLLKVLEGQHKWTRDQQILIQLMDGAVNAGKLSPDYKDYITIQVMAGFNVERMARVVALVSDLYNMARRHGYQSSVEKQNQIIKAGMKQVLAITQDPDIRKIMFNTLQQLMLEAGLPLAEFRKFAAAIPPPQVGGRAKKTISPEELEESDEDDDE